MALNWRMWVNSSMGFSQMGRLGDFFFERWTICVGATGVLFFDCGLVPTFLMKS